MFRFSCIKFTYFRKHMKLHILEVYQLEGIKLKYLNNWPFFSREDIAIFRRLPCNIMINALNLNALSLILLVFVSGHCWLGRKRSRRFFHIRRRSGGQIPSQARLRPHLPRASGGRRRLRILCQTTIGHAFLGTQLLRGI